MVTEKYAAAHGQLEVQRKKAQAARFTEDRFIDENAVAKFVIGKGGGFGLWALGLCIVIVAAPRLWNPQWINTAIIGFGLAVQFAATILIVYWGVRLSRAISRAVRAVSETDNPASG